MYIYINIWPFPQYFFGSFSQDFPPFSHQFPRQCESQVTFPKASAGGFDLRFSPVSRVDLEETSGNPYTYVYIYVYIYHKIYHIDNIYIYNIVYNIDNIYI